MRSERLLLTTATATVGAVRSQRIAAVDLRHGVGLDAGTAAVGVQLLLDSGRDDVGQRRVPRQRQLSSCARAAEFVTRSSGSTSTSGLHRWRLETRSSSKETGRRGGWIGLR